ncbi:hypothetical protein IMG5_034010, partial [Ichthyophthirius multifiliis]
MDVRFIFGSLITFSNYEFYITIFVSLGVGIICGVITNKCIKFGFFIIGTTGGIHVLIYSSSLIGSYLIARAISLYIGYFPNEYTISEQIKVGNYKFP